QPRQPLGRFGVAGLDGPGPAGAEAGQRAEQAGGGPVEDGPQVRQVVLDGGAGEGDAGGGGDVAQGAGGGRGGVLDVLGLVGDDQVPRVRGQPGGVQAHGGVRGEHEPFAGQVAGGAVEAAH